MIDIIPGNRTSATGRPHIAVWGLGVTDRRAEAWADLNAVVDGMVPGCVVDWACDRPYRVGDRFTLVSEEYDSTAAELIEIFADSPMYGRFRVLGPWVYRGPTA